MPICGRCKRNHASVAAVRACYFGAAAGPSALIAAEAHGRRGLAADGATEITAEFLRNVATPSEKELWRWLRRGFRGYRFDFQVPLLGYVVDFYCPTLQLVVEVDGASHRTRAELDSLRDDVLRANHLAVLRLPASLVLDDIQSALRQLNLAMRARAAQRLRPARKEVVPLPLSSAGTTATPCCARSASASNSGGSSGANLQMPSRSGTKDVPLAKGEAASLESPVLLTAPRLREEPFHARTSEALPRDVRARTPIRRSTGPHLRNGSAG